MKNYLILLTLLLSSSLDAKVLLYQVEENDQLGTLLLSMGHRKLWSKDGKVNQFKRQQKIKFPDYIYEGMFLKIPEDQIIFKKNIIISDDNFRFIRKINSNEMYEELLKLEAVTPEQIADQPTPAIEILPAKQSDSPDLNILAGNKKPELRPDHRKAKKPQTIHSFNFYPGIGVFMANNEANDGAVQTTTSTGLQPMVQLKGIYSTDLFGTLSIDLLSKKIFNNQFSFPVNIDYRAQLVPKWNISDSFKLALSHSTLRHSYVGKNSDNDIAHEIKSNFFGIGLVMPQENYWVELYIEKAYSGKSISSEREIKADKGMRVDTEVIIPLYNNWKLIPGLNYYKLKDTDINYDLSVFEARMVMAMEFEL